ncbi:hypothetical protein BRD00_14705 [Halobacteriales archaeon QS_8_69_26]|nr:MAG: hypothetical protein BRD00_14705 [Halobacteriales archaeon QS_8_69_26]
MEGAVVRGIVPAAVATLVVLAGAGTALAAGAGGPADAERPRVDGGLADAGVDPARTAPGSQFAAGSQSGQQLATGPGDHERPTGSLDEHEPPTDATVTRIRVHPNGTATWTVEIRTLLANDSDVEGYRRFQDRFRGDTDRYLGSFHTRMTRLVNRAATVTGREMRAGNFTAETSIENAPRRWGVVTYRFRWEGFAVAGDDELRVGDVFESGYYLSGSDSLVVEAPEGYDIDEAVPEPASTGSTTVRWAGPVDFGDGRPSVRMVATDAAPADGPDGEEPGFPVVPAVLGGALLAVAGLAAYVVAGRRRGPTVGPTAGDDGTGGEPGPVAGADTDPAASGGSDATASTGSGPAARGGGSGRPGGSGTGAAAAGSGAGTDDGASAGGSTGGDAATPGESPGAVPDGELVTNEEQVIGLLERNGGRMRQADIADELDWSAPKTSRVLSSMAEEGDVEKLRLGNENVIDLVEE